MFELGLINRWDGFMLGPAEITVSVPIYNQVSSLLLTGDSTPVIFSVGGKYVHKLCTIVPQMCIGTCKYTQWARHT